VVLLCLYHYFPSFFPNLLVSFLFSQAVTFFGKIKKAKYLFLLRKTKSTIHIYTYITFIFCSAIFVKMLLYNFDHAEDGTKEKERD
jgi:hypothetical protein